jgi:hypothetical protein
MVAVCSDYGRPRLKGPGRVQRPPAAIGRLNILAARTLRRATSQRRDAWQRYPLGRVLLREHVAAAAEVAAHRLSLSSHLATGAPLSAIVAHACDDVRRPVWLQVVNVDPRACGQPGDSYT